MNESVVFDLMMILGLIMLHVGLWFISPTVMLIVMGVLYMIGGLVGARLYTNRGKD